MTYAMSEVRTNGARSLMGQNGGKDRSLEVRYGGGHGQERGDIRYWESERLYDLPSTTTAWQYYKISNYFSGDFQASWINPR